MAVIRVAEAHVDRLMELRQRYPIDETDLLSDAPWRRKGLVDTVFRRDRDIPQEIKRQIGNLQVQLRMAIIELARRMEDDASAAVERTIGTFPFAVSERKAATDLVMAQKEINISVRTLQITVAAFRELNQRIIARLAQAEEDGISERDLLLANAILVYEVSDFVIRYVEEFELWGMQMIQAIRNKVNSGIDELERQDRKLMKDARGPAVDLATRQRTLELIALREQAVWRVRQEWEAFDREIARIKDIAGPIKRDRLPTLRVIRGNARAQIHMVNVLALTAAAKEAVACLDAAIGDVEGLELAPMTLERVERLLNVSV